MFTDKERYMLHYAGFQALDFIAALAASTLMYGMLIVVFCIAASVIRGQNPTISMKIMSGMTLLAFLLGTVYWIAYLVYAFGFIRHAFHKGTGIAFDGVWLDDVYSRSFIPVQMTVWSRQLLQIVGDAIVIWRGWVLCGGRAMILPLLLLLAVSSTTFAYFGLTITYAEFLADGYNNSLISDHLFVASGALSTAANAITTLLIGLLAWRYYRMWEFSGGQQKSRAQKVLLLFIESGSLYCAFQILNTVFINLLVEHGTNMEYVTLVFREFYTQLTAIYPMAVLILVHEIGSSAQFGDNVSKQDESSVPSSI